MKRIKTRKLKERMNSEIMEIPKLVKSKEPGSLKRVVLYAMMTNFIFPWFWVWTLYKHQRFVKLVRERNKIRTTEITLTWRIM